MKNKEGNKKINLHGCRCSVRKVSIVTKVTSLLMQTYREAKPCARDYDKDETFDDNHNTCLHLLRALDTCVASCQTLH